MEDMFAQKRYERRWYKIYFIYLFIYLL